MSSELKDVLRSISSGQRIIDPMGSQPVNLAWDNEPWVYNSLRSDGWYEDPLLWGELAEKAQTWVLIDGVWVERFLFATGEMEWVK